MKDSNLGRPKLEDGDIVYNRQGKKFVYLKHLFMNENGGVFLQNKVDYTKHYRGDYLLWECFTVAMLNSSKIICESPCNTDKLMSILKP